MKCLLVVVAATCPCVLPVIGVGGQVRGELIKGGYERHIIIGLRATDKRPEVVFFVC